jgi:DNA replication protein DnaC
LKPPQRKCRCGKADDLKDVEFKDGTKILLCGQCRSELAERRLKVIRTGHKHKATSLRNSVDIVIPPLFRSARLNHLNDSFRRKLLKDRELGLVLYGPTGTGKSYAMCALLRSLIVSGQYCKRIGYENLCMSIRDAFKVGSKLSELDVIKPFFKPDVLLIEDLGAGRPLGSQETEFSLRVIYVLLDMRIEQMKTTYITTNKTRQNLKDSFDERIASRLSLMTWLGVGGEDMRK